MPMYVLKKYHRQAPGLTVGLLVAEWMLDEPSDGAAVATAESQLQASGFQLPDDFAVLFDHGYGLVWDKGANA